MGIRAYLTVAAVCTVWLTYLYGAYGFMPLAVGYAGGAAIYGRRKRSAAFERQPCSPSTFELWCASCLEKSGWRIQHVGKPGDFGADVMAWRDGDMMVVQCKDYGSPVGVSGVQQVSSARMHYSATRAALVATSGFTDAARVLAKTNDVILLSPSDLVTGNSN